MAEETLQITEKDILYCATCGKQVLFDDAPRTEDGTRHAIAQHAGHQLIVCSKAVADTKALDKKIDAMNNELLRLDGAVNNLRANADIKGPMAAELDRKIMFLESRLDTRMNGVLGEISNLKTSLFELPQLVRENNNDANHRIDIITKTVTVLAERFNEFERLSSYLGAAGRKKKKTGRRAAKKAPRRIQAARRVVGR